MRNIVPVVVLWAVVLGRLSMLRRPGSPRVLWAALAFLAGAETLQIQAVYRKVSDVLGSPVGGPTVKLALAVGAAAGVRTLIVTLTTGQPVRAARRDWLLAVGTVVVLTVPLLVAPPSRLNPAVLATTEFYDSTWRSLVHWLPFLSYLSWALGGGVALCWRYGRQAPHGPLRAGLGLIGSGCATGFIYVALKLAILTAWHTDPAAAPHWMAVGDGVIGSAVLAVSIVLIAIGCAWEAIVAQADAFRNWLWAARSLRRLRPLWAALVSLHPTIALSEATDRGGIHRLRFRLLRRVVEIRDGVLAMQDELDPAAVTAARARARAAGHAGPEADAVVLAILVRWASHNRATNPSRIDLPGGDGTDLQSEVQWLTLVATAFQDPVLVQQTAKGLTTATA